ncbi:MAG: histidinol-phosphate transaminase [Candidatus Omnitrophica bacterium]|nr:histidinol-phosphate transaminase [Candidatus Omnitrophota bacterium]
MKKLWKQILDEIAPYEPGKPIEEVKRELGLDKVIKLASNESPYGPSEKVLEAIMEAAKSANRYPDGGCFYLRKALSKKLSISGEKIVFGNGSDELIILALRAFVHPGEEIIISDPTFLVYKIASRIVGADVVTVPVKDFKYDLEAIAERITPQTKMIFIANPENPTGTYISGDELKRFIEKVPKDVVVFIDEAYYEFAVGGDYPETIDLIEREDKNIIVSRTFSKAYGLAGLRLGYIMARKDLAEAVNKVREPFNINSVAQAAAITALDDTESVNSSIKLTKEEKEKLYKAFDKLDIKYIPSRTNFILIDTKRDSKKVFDYMLRSGIIIREMSAWALEGFVRVNMGLPEENEEFLRVFTEALEKIPIKR